MDNEELCEGCQLHANVVDAQQECQAVYDDGGCPVPKPDGSTLPLAVEGVMPPAQGTRRYVIMGCVDVPDNFDGIYVHEQLGARLKQDNDFAVHIQTVVELGRETTKED